LPQALRLTASTTGGYAALRFSATSLDRSSTPDSVVVPEYDNEDLSYWPAREQPWSLAEHAGKRSVFAVPASAF
jgi:hypothetical protein